MNKHMEGFVQVGIPASAVVERINPEAYAEFQLRQALADAIKAIGKERTLKIIHEEAA